VTEPSPEAPGPSLDGVPETTLRGLPKAELHLHFEGAFRWATIRELHRGAPALPERRPWLDRPRPFPDFEDFRQVFRAFVRPASGTPDTIERHAFEVIEDLAAQNVRYAEVIVSMPLHTWLGLSADAVWIAIARGRERAMARYPIDVRLIYGVSRNRPPGESLEDLEVIAKLGVHRGWLSGIDLQNDERVGTPRDFAGIYRRAADLGLKLRAHAGEIRGAESVRETLRDLGVTQIAHGVRAVEDSSLVGELAERGVFLHVCPTSNVLLECAPSLRDHPLRPLLAAGVRCTLNSDDPLILGTDLLREYRLAVRDMGLSRAELGELVKNGFRASLLDTARVQTFCAEVDAALSS
jgi:adenosine deaminase